MGWSGYDIYGGDDTQTLHYDYLKRAKVSKDDEEISGWLSLRKTKIPKDRVETLALNLDKILVKMPKSISNRWNVPDEDKAIEWQMLAALLIDNGLKLPTKVYEMAKIGTEFLMGEHASKFRKPKLRRACLRRFLKKLETNV